MLRWGRFSLVKKLFSILTLVVSFSVSSQSRANIYSFQNLWHDLGYIQDSWFQATPEETLSIEDYINKHEENYKEINRFLRQYPHPYEWYGKSPAQARRDVRNIDKIFKRAPDLPADLIMFRGVRLDWKKDKKFNVGEIFSDKAFISTSTDLKIAAQFTYDDSENGASIFVLYFNQPHSKGILINQGEDEVLLQRGQKFKVMARNMANQKTFYLVQVCGFSACSQIVQQKTALSYWQSGQYLKTRDNFK